MNKMIGQLVLLLIVFLTTTPSFAQKIERVKWWNPEDSDSPVIEGQYWFNEVKDSYDRFPERAQQSLRPAVWDLSHNSAGLSIKFRTDSKDIIVRYAVTSRLAMHHMPTTGVSGLDLYAVDLNGKWHWSAGKFLFGDTIEYRFSNLEVNKEIPSLDHEFRLYLPLYNTVQWLEIGVGEDNVFEPLPLIKDKPIVVYGTSIAQGACASRPGLAWTSILERRLGRQLVNLGFSGNGQLETPVLNLMTEVDAAVYVLDCLPNLTDKTKFPSTEVEKRIINAILLLQQRKPDVPILLVEHSGGNFNSTLDYARQKECEDINLVLRQAYKRLLVQGIKNIHILDNQEINFDINSTVDGVHPNDIGMRKYADAYEKALHLISY